jgi:hypothetical protein
MHEFDLCPASYLLLEAAADITGRVEKSPAQLEPAIACQARCVDFDTNGSRRRCFESPPDTGTGRRWNAR